MSPAIRPSLMLVRLVVIALAALDWVASRRDPSPLVERVVPERMVKGRPNGVTYRVSRPGGAATVVSILDELPADIGGDLVVEGIKLERDQRRELTREIMPLRSGTRELGPTLVAWRSRL